MQSQKKQIVVFQTFEWWPAAGRRTSNALIPIVGDEAANAEDYKALCDVEGPCVYEKQDRIRTKSERERERGTKNISIKNATVTTRNNQPLQKVTRSLYIVTHLGQLPFMLFT